MLLFHTPKENGEIIFKTVFGMNLDPFINVM